MLAGCQAPFHTSTGGASSPGIDEVDPHGACGFCGAVEGPMVHSYQPGGAAYVLWCADAATREARQGTEAAWAEQRFTSTAAGRAALALAAREVA